MSEIKLVVRDAARDLSATVTDAFAEVAAAALSADPVTLEELAVALERFHEPDPRGFWAPFAATLDDQPAAAGLVVLDLSARLVVVDTDCFSVEQSGQVIYLEAELERPTPVRYDLADDWLVVGDRLRWRALAETRRRGLDRGGPWDPREILYGTRLQEFLARECLVTAQARLSAISSSRPRGSRLPALPPVDEEMSWKGPDYEAIKDIHARWLMTAREDLRGQTPREVLLAQHSHLSSDLEHRRDQWSRQETCPRGLDATSHAYRFGGFGTHELVMYYRYVRALLWACWSRLCTLSACNTPSLHPLSLTVEKFLDGETSRLAKVAEQWLDSPDPELENRTPRAIVHRERSRLPEVVSPEEAVIDHDCPCCQMLAELPGPVFLHLDGSNMEWEFPFDIYYRTREEWELDYGQTGPCELPVTRVVGESGPIWSRSMTAIPEDELTVGVRLFGIGGHLAELLVDLRELGADAVLGTDVNRHFANVRGVLLEHREAAEDSALLEPVIDAFCDCLATVSVQYPSLEAKCADLARQIHLLRGRGPAVSATPAQEEDSE